MKQTASLDDYALFLSVAEAGGLAGASRATGVPVPTLSRRMTALERQTGEHLFQRGKRGYALTARGRALAEAAAPLRAAAAEITQFNTRHTLPRVRITAGAWTSRFIVRNLPRVWSAADGWVPEFLSSTAIIDIARREADIGIRNRRPEQGWLAGRLTSHVTPAVYTRDPEAVGFVSLSEDIRATDYQRWIRANHGSSIVTTANDTRLCLDMVQAGIGRTLLPTFIGDTEPELQRVGEPIRALRHEEWLVSHHDGRHDTPVRRALDALTALLTDRRLRPEP